MARVTGFGWGKYYPADYWDAEVIKTMTYRKWWPWTPSNELAGKEFMKNGLYLVRCFICKEERYQQAAVYFCLKRECQESVAVLIELGFDESWVEDADSWYSSWYDESAEEARREPQNHFEVAVSIHDEAIRTTHAHYREPKRPGS